MNRNTLKALVLILALTLALQAQPPPAVAVTGYSQNWNRARLESWKSMFWFIPGPVQPNIQVWFHDSGTQATGYFVTIHWGRNSDRHFVPRSTEGTGQMFTSFEVDTSDEVTFEISTDIPALTGKAE